VSAAEPTLADAGFTETARTIVTRDRAARLAACIDADPAVLDTGELPLLWHWACFLPLVTTAHLGIDGHPRRRAEMDAFPQRMWVGGRVQVERPLRLDLDAARRSRIVRADVKDGSAGRFWLVTVGHVVSQDDEVCIDEEQDLVFREAAAVVAPGPDRDDAPEAEWVEELVADPVLLFRFSAVTANAHRIHYDHPYATTVEGYPDLVVHGPLTAILLAELARRRTRRAWHAVSYRARAPHFANRPFWLTGTPNTEGVDLAAVRADHAVAMTLEVR
jgi:3-methylfumaryl-CoA hydratase